MNRKVVFIFILISLSPHLAFSQTLLPGSKSFDVGPLLIEFDAWLGADKITPNVGREAEIRLYVLNLGNAVDSYTIDVKPTELDVNLVSDTIDNVYPQDVKFTSILVSTPRVVKDKTVEFNVCSMEEPDKCKSLNITVTTLVPESLPESNMILILLLLSSLIVLKKL